MTVDDGRGGTQPVRVLCMIECLVALGRLQWYSPDLSIYQLLVLNEMGEL